MKALTITALLLTLTINTAAAEGRNDRVSHPRTVLKSGIAQALKTGKPAHVALNPGSLQKHTVLFVIRKLHRGAKPRLYAWSTTSFKAKWEHPKGNLNRIHIHLNGKGHKEE